jgi:multiple sugar transport system substrate-binding protein
MKRVKVFLFVTMIMMLLVTACGPKKPEVPVVNLRLGVDSGMSPPIIAVLQEAITSWNADNPAIQVVVEVTPEYWTKIPTAFSAGTAPDIIYDTITETTSTFAELGMYLSLDDYIANSTSIKPADFVQGIWNTAVWNGHTWVIPYNWSNIGVVYNKDMFDAANVAYPQAGWTWDDFLATAQALTKDTNDDGTPDQYGFYDDSWPYLGIFPFILSNGGQILSTDKSTVIADSPEGMEAITFYIDLVRNYHVAPTAPELGENTNPFATGVVAMQLTRSWAPATFKDIAPNLKFGVTSVPMKVKRINYFEGAGFGINSKSLYPDQTWQVLEFLAGETHQKKMADLQIYFPVRNSVLNQVQWNDALKAFLDEAQYGLDLQVVSQWETLTSNFFFWLGTAVGGVDPIDIPTDVAGIIEKCNTELAKHPIK